MSTENKWKHSEIKISKNIALSVLLKLLKIYKKKIFYEKDCRSKFGGNYRHRSCPNTLL